MKRIIDLRSDTVTPPTELMRQAMMTAEVGDDVFGDDPTVISLQKKAACMLGMQAALFVPSGTFGNQLAILTHTKRGDEILVDSDAHILIHETGAAAVISGVQVRNIKIKNRNMDMNVLASMFRTKDIHHPDTGLLCLENARADGSVMPLDTMQAIYETAKKHQVPVHMDGARYFNATTALGVAPHQMAAFVDSVSVCLSKGLCAPIGSLLIGKAEFIEKARKYRKMMGGGMRQVGVLAAPGHIALDKMTKRLAKDHENAFKLAERLDLVEGIAVQKDRLDINMVFFRIEKPISSENFVKEMERKGIKMMGEMDGEYRLVTHYYIDSQDVDTVCKAISETLQSIESVS